MYDLDHHLNRQLAALDEQPQLFVEKKDVAEDWAMGKDPSVVAEHIVKGVHTSHAGEFMRRWRKANNITA